jgi:hypothetical protein
VVVVRCLVRQNNAKDCQKRVDIKKREGWKAITDIIEDTSHISWGEISFVCVMEKEDSAEHKEKSKNRRFNRFYRQD